MTVVHLLVLLFLLTLSLCNLSFSLTEDEALLQFKKSLTQTDALDDWVSGSNPCVEKWAGAICSRGALTGLHLSNMGLSGTIDVEALQQLPGLRTISFGNNKFSGPIPQFNKLGTLKSLLLSQNKFSGEIPNDFFARMSSLKKIWISNNTFTGKIPESVMQLSHLKELHLEWNQFSGQIPPLKQPKLLISSLNFSHNKLEGEIPSSFSTFTAASFAENDGLCGKPLDKSCSNPSPPPTIVRISEATYKTDSKSTTWVGVVMLAIIVLMIFCAMCPARRGNKEDDFSRLEKENLDEVGLSRRGQGSSRRPASESSRKSTSSRRAPINLKNRMGDMIMLNAEKGSFGMSDLMKAAAQVLGNGGLGSAYKAMLTNGLSVVVKRIREMNMLGKDAFDAEMRRFGRTNHKNILAPLAFHFRKEEKLMVTEFMPNGSLLYVLHGDRGICHAALDWPTRLKIIKGIANGLRFLYTNYSNYNLPHGNLKSSNVLLNETYEPLLTDYALDPLINPNHSARTMFGYKSPEYVANRQVSRKSDVYCLGIIILEVMTGKFPSQYLSNGRGGTDVVQWVRQASSEGKEQELIDPEIASNSSSESLQQMVQLLRVGATCTESNAAQRIDMKEAVRRIEEIQV